MIGTLYDWKMYLLNVATTDRERGLSKTIADLGRRSDSNACSAVVVSVFILATQLRHPNDKRIAVAHQTAGMLIFNFRFCFADCFCSRLVRSVRYAKPTWHCKQYQLHITFETKRIRATTEKTVLSNNNRSDGIELQSLSDQPVDGMVRRCRVLHLRRINHGQRWSRSPIHVMIIKFFCR